MATVTGVYGKRIIPTVALQTSQFELMKGSEAMQKFEGAYYNFKLTPDLRERLDLITKHTGRKRAQVIRDMLDVCLELHDILDPNGVFFENYDRVKEMKEFLRKELSPA